MIKKKDMTNNNKLILSKNIAVIAGVFSVLVALLLLLNYWQVSKTDPIESETLQALVERLKDDPNNDALKMEIRNFDLLARKAFFNSQWQVKTGAWLLLFGAVVLAFALRIYYSTKQKIEEPDLQGENEIASRILAQKGILIVGAAIMILAFVVSFVSEDYLENYVPETQVAVVEADPAEAPIEVIEVKEIPEKKEVEEVVETEVVAEKQPAKEETKPEAKEETVAVKEETPKPAAKPKKKAAGLTFEALKKQHNSFRGPLAQGIVYHKNIPEKWDGASGENILWKSPIPKHGYNSPVIWGDKVFIAGADKTNREVYCYNSKTGALLWTGVADNITGSPASPPKVTEDTGLSAPTVATNGKAVFAIFGTGDIIAFDANGKRLWARNLGVPDNHYGHSSSLLLLNDKLFVQYDTNKGGKVLALNSENGETQWETKREAKISWASPVLAQVDGNYQLILTADPIVAGYDPETGEELWKVECMMGEVGPSVAFSEGTVFAANEYATLAAINPKDGSILWENDEYLPEAASPLAHEGLLVIATSYGVLACYDTKTGDQYWEHDVGTTLYGSPMVADGKLFMMDNDGIMRVYAFAKEMTLLSENELDEMAATTPAFADGKIYIRGKDNLYCIGKK